MVIIPALTNWRNWCILDNNMRNKYKIASLYFFLAEHSLRGLKAWARRVMAEWLKTPCLVLSRDLSNQRLDSSWKIVGKPINPTKDALFINVQ